VIFVALMRAVRADVFRETHQSSRSRHKIGQGKVYYRDTACITKLYPGSWRLLKEDASRRSTSIEYEFEDPVLEVLVDRYQIQQIIINLVTNAIDAKQDIDRQPLPRIRIRNAEGGQVLTELIDNGNGLPDACFTIWRASACVDKLNFFS
jgi:signal transduction histidine kinase